MTPTTRRVTKILLVTILIAVALLPAVVFLRERGGLGELFSGETRDDIRKLFPFFGLYALFLLWVQILLGSLMPWVVRVFPRVLTFHRTEGIVALLFACLHPLLLTYVVGLDGILQKSFIAPERAIFVTFGQLALLLLFITVLTALLRRRAFLRRHWRIIHLLNYLVFVFAWFHSWNIGTDVRTTGLRYLWIFYGVTAACAVFLRLFRLRTKRTPATVPQTPPAPQ